MRERERMRERDDTDEYGKIIRISRSNSRWIQKGLKFINQII